MGRVPHPRLPRRRRGLSAEPRREADEPLLPRAAGAARGAAAGAGRAGRRDRHRRRGRAASSRPCSCASTPPPRGWRCWPSRCPPRSCSGICWRSATRTCARRRSRRRRQQLEQALAGVRPPVHLTPATRDRALALDWFTRFEGAGLDGVIAKPLDQPYKPGERGMLKVKHERTADCVVAGFRWHKNGPGTMIGSLLLGILRRPAAACSTWASPPASAPRSARSWWPSWLPCAKTPWRATPGGNGATRARRSRQADARRHQPLEPGQGPQLGAAAPRAGLRGGLRPPAGTRFRHATHFRRWRPDKRPEDCRYDQLEETAPFELSEIFAAGRPAAD